MPEPMEPAEITRILSDSKLRSTALRAMLSVWEDDVLDQLILDSFARRAEKIHFIVNEDLAGDEAAAYFNFNQYPDHEEPLRRAGLIREPGAVVPSLDLVGQPELFPSS